MDSPDFIKSEAEWIPIPNSLKAIALLNGAGFKVVVATNQSGIARGLYSLETLEKIHQKMNQAVKEQGGLIEQIFYCPHGPDENCVCRKPKPGLLLQIAEKYHLDIHNSNIPCIGDSLRDLEAAKTLGLRPILVLTGNGQKTKNNLPESLQSIEIYPDLLQAAQVLISENVSQKIKSL